MPIHSMTGFGVAERPWTERGVRVHVELRSVNARYLEIKLRQPFGVAVEHGLRRAVEARLGRGRVDLAIRLEGSGDLSADPLEAFGLRSETLAPLLRALASVEAQAARAELELSRPTSLDLLRFLASGGGGGGGGGRGGSEHQDAPPFLDELVGEALDKLGAMRVSEGDALAVTLAGYYTELEEQVARIEAELTGEPERLLAQLGARAQALLARADAGPLEPERLVQEIALLVTRGDVSEEVARIASHLDQARSTLAADQETGQGKTLDFLSQELLREVTTIGSKITSHAGSAVVIDAKRTIERIREQVQNVE